MGKVYDSILELIGKTPIVALHKIKHDANIVGNIYAKLEYFNPFGSVKDRIALNMIEAAERSGKLKPGETIIEGTSGNTGIGLSAVAAAKGYKAIICMPDNMKGANTKVEELASANPNAVVIGQGGNPNNPNAHFKTTGPEIWNDLGGKVDIFIASTGTGGTITGVGDRKSTRLNSSHL